MKLKVGKGRLRTETVKKTLEPAWKKCSFPFQRPPPGAVLKVTVLDDDLLSKDDKIGLAIVPLDTIEPGAAKVGWNMV